MKKFFQEFKEFAMRGNVMDLAVGVIVGGAFSSITTSLINDIIMPIIGIFVSEASLRKLSTGRAQLYYYGLYRFLHGESCQPPYPQEESGSPPSPARTFR